MLFKKVYLLETDFEIIGISAISSRNGVLFIDTFWVDDVKNHLKGAYALLKRSIGKEKSFYFEVQKENPALIDNWYKKSIKIYETKKKIIYKRVIDV